MQNQAVRRNSQIQEEEEKRGRGHKIDLDEVVHSNSVYDHGFDPPQKDSGRGTGSLQGGHYRNNDHI